ncbi:DUF4268 domain-containing protein [Paraburkholderia sp. MM5482-R1]|uniref:DUF4268 domain-containing protein n=1 Tax=unclassified Paraburkholderia TaxID=2615204 RepID=UPI003D1BE0E4
MYRVDQTNNRIVKLEEVKFSERGLRERNHLQEWLANKPDALGEDLLIIQKEFDGFDDTRERLDLLAIDRNGGLVVIENKRDDSGRDVVWQSLKYASYCSTLSKTQIADIFQEYLNGRGETRDARRTICEFLKEEDFADVVLNPGNDQRIFMVAAQFRKEVTSTALWLLKHRILLKCFKATLFTHQDQLFVNVEQVIPLPEAEELMIGIADKEVEEQSSERGKAYRYELRNEFWHMTLEALREANISLYSSASPSRDHWLNAGSGLGNVAYTMIFNRGEARAEFILGRVKEENKAAFDFLHSKKDVLEAEFGEPLYWRRMDDNKISIIGCAKQFDAHVKENWPAIIEWLVDHVRRLEKTFQPLIPQLRTVLQESYFG